MILYLFLFLSFAGTGWSQGFFSNSVVIMNGSNTIATPSSNPRLRGVQAQIDWSRVPELGVPKNEIHTITIINRECISYDGGKIILKPYKWHFTADEWTVEYTGRIPYLEELDFLPNDKNITKMYNEILLIRNNLGYYIDKDTLYSGMYQHIHNASTNTAALVYIITAQENKEIFDMIKTIEYDIISEELLKQTRENLDILEPSAVPALVPLSEDMSQRIKAS